MKPRKVRVKKFKRDNFGNNKAIILHGLLIHWGIDSQEGIGPATIGLVELNDGTIIEAYPFQIKFEDVYPIEELAVEEDL